MAEEERDDGQRRRNEPPWPRALAQRDPDRQRPERQPDAEHIVHHADEQHFVVDDDPGNDRHHRPAAEQRAVERKRAAQDQDQRREREDLPGVIDGHEPVQDRHHQIHHQIGDDPPLDGVKALQVGVRADGRDHMRARERVEVVGERQQRVGEDRHRDGRRHREEQEGDRRRADGAVAFGSPVAHARHRSVIELRARRPEDPAESNRPRRRRRAIPPLPPCRPAR